MSAFQQPSLMGMKDCYLSLQDLTQSPIKEAKRPAVASCGEVSTLFMIKPRPKSSQMTPSLDQVMRE